MTFKECQLAKRHSAFWHSAWWIQHDGIQQNDIQQSDIQQSDIQQNDILQNDILQNDIMQNDIQQNGIQQNDILKNYIQQNDIRTDGIRQNDKIIDTLFNNTNYGDQNDTLLHDILPNDAQMTTAWVLMSCDIRATFSEVSFWLMSWHLLNDCLFLYNSHGSNW